jgi:hypothetical protein
MYAHEMTEGCSWAQDSCLASTWQQLGFTVDQMQDRGFHMLAAETAFVVVRWLLNHFPSEDSCLGLPSFERYINNTISRLGQPPSAPDAQHPQNQIRTMEFPSHKVVHVAFP